MNQKELEKLLKKNKLEHLLEKLGPELRHSIRLETEEYNEKELKLGQSKIGGKPDLPESISWQKDSDGNLLAFIAQINLAEVTDLDAEKILPKTGILYFFYDALQEACGYEMSEKEANRFRVLYFDGDLNILKRTNYPKDLGKEARFSVNKITAKQEINIPYSDFLFEVFDEDEAEKLDELISDVDDGSIHKMLGYSNNLQNPMEIECELITNGVDINDPEAFETPKAKELAKNTVDWRLLLQVDSTDGEVQMDWAGGGRIYFWIKKEDLLNKNFDKFWFSLQCY
jgi:uncharacterized protein YwqG